MVPRDFGGFGTVSDLGVSRFGGPRIRVWGSDNGSWGSDNGSWGSDNGSGGPYTGFGGWVDGGAVGFLLSTQRSSSSLCCVVFGQRHNVGLALIASSTQLRSGVARCLLLWGLCVPPSGSWDSSLSPRRSLVVVRRATRAVSADYVTILELLNVFALRVERHPGRM